MPNQLAGESSPYLLQHAHNPVNWHPWEAKVLERAKREDKPIFLSIGYSACHWCHVMEHESFENESIAHKLNSDFISIKVDREERPDLDQIYMNAVQMMTGRGGWPMSVFLTPDLEPFFGGTYWPPESRMGMPGFSQVLDAVADAWRNQRQQALDQAHELTRHLQHVGPHEHSQQGLRLELLHEAAVKLEQGFDFTHGGFGGAPKFPHSLDLQLLLRVWRRSRRASWLDRVKLTLDKMARGGIYDHLGGGFARYSVDDRWLVPHFEKMLYDNALLAGAYLDAFQVTENAEYSRIVREILDYVLRDMTDSEGGFHSTEDADSEGEEGKFYLWTRDEIVNRLGPEAGERFCYVYDVTQEGNFESQNILNLPKTIAQCAALRGWERVELERELTESRAKLLAARSERVRPGKDDKVLVSWNALMIDSLARAAGVLGESKYLDAAVRATNFLLTKVRRSDGRLLHSWRQGQAKFDAYLDDYANLINALVTLYETNFDERWIDEAVRLADILLRHFAAKEGGFFFTADDHERLIARNQDWYDSSVPSGNAMAATALLRLGTLTGRSDFLASARATLESAVAVMERTSMAAGQMLIALDMYFDPLPEIVILGGSSAADNAAVLSDLRHRFVPNRVLAMRASDTPPHRSPHLVGLFATRAAGPQPTVFVCERFTCQAPVSGTEAIRNLWDKLSSL